MALILAIEPDKRQASQLTAIVRGRLKAELVLADSADRALAALGDRVPDLILTAALLPPKDESALDDRLRSLNGAAAHIQTLTIPVLATKSGSKGGGILSSLRRDKPQPSHTPDGCDPAVFAEQCKEYLVRAVSERQEQSAQFGELAAPVAAAIDIVPVQDTASEQDFDLAVGDDRLIEPAVEPIAEPVAPPPPVDVHVPRVGAILDLTPDPQPTPQPEPQPQPVAQVAPPPPPPAAIEPERPARKPRRRKKTYDLESTDALVAALAMLEAEDDKAVVERPVAERPAAAAAPQPAAQHAVERKVDAEAHASEPTFSETQLYTHLSPRSAWSWPAMGAMTAEAVKKVADQVARRNGPTNTQEPAQEWVDIIEALRRDAEQIPTRRTSTAAAAPAPAPPAPADAGAQPMKRKKKRHAAQPAQDEWGFFDPDRCGFAALLEKLEEITEDDPRPQPSRA